MPAPLAPTLSWVKPEVDHALKSVREDIARLLADPAAVTLLKKSPDQIHQVTGALNILGLDGAVRFCESVEQALSAVTAQPVVKPSVAGTLDRAVLALKEFIDGLAKGGSNAPIRLFPLYREISGLHGKTDVTEKDLFFPDLAPDAPVSTAAVTVALEKLPAALLAQRSRFQRGLLATLRTPAAQDGLRDMRAALEALAAIAAQLQPPRSLWWAATGLIDGLMHPKASAAWKATAKSLCGKIDLRIRDLAKGDTPDMHPLLRDVLYAIAKCDASSPRLREIKQLYQLDSLFPEPDMPGLMEFDMDWLEPALNEVRARVQSIKDAWIQYVSGDSVALQTLRESAAALKAKIHDLGNVQMIRMIDLVAIVLTRLPNPYPRQSQLMITEMASAFLLIENIVDRFTDAPPGLDRQVEIMGGWLLDAVKGGAAKPVPPGLQDELTQEISRLKLQMQVAREILSNLQHVEQILDGYARDHARIDTLASLPPYLKQIHGALSVVGFDRAAEVQSICNKLIAKCASADPAWKDTDMDTIVEGLSSLGFFLDPCLRGMAPVENALDVFFERLALRNAPPPAVTAGSATDISVRASISIIEPHILPAVEPVAKPATADPVAALAEFENELLDVFLEEAREVIAAIGNALPACRANAQDIDALTTIRRGFHTLKGSGRMVGLNDLGETAWEIEQAMNHWLEQRWPATPALLEMIELATRSFTTWVGELSERKQPVIDAGPLTAMATALKTATAADTGTVAAIAPPQPEPAAAAPVAEPDEIVIGPARVSKAFFDIYRKEAQQHLATLHSEIGAWCKAPGSKASSPLEIAAHTLASISRTAGLAPPADLAMRLEQCLPNARLVSRPEDLELLQRTAASLDAMLDDISRQQYPAAADGLIAELDALIQRLQSPPVPDPEPAVAENLAETAQAPAPSAAEPAAADAAFELEPIDDAALVRAAATQTVQEQRAIRDDLDPDLLPIFLEEALELLPQISRDLRDWKNAPGDAQIQQALQRALHTLKGSARMAGAMRLGELTHLMESRLEAAIATGTPTMALLDDIELQVDRLSEGVERLRAPAVAEVTPAAPITATQPAPVTAPASAGGGPLPHPEVPLQGAAMLRIHADTLDRLINEAGEVGIARSRIEGELRNIKQSLQELDESMSRLKSQLREIEVQADSQMQSRQSVIAADRPEFDPLEFDRYTRLQELTRLMSESLHDVSTVQQTLLRNVGEVEAAVLQQARGSRDLQQGLMRTRTVPFSNLDERLYRIARQTARQLDKKINLEINDSHIELDRSVLERIGAPLEHLLRNAIAHGIEPPAQRRAAGKPETGEISISLRQESNEIAIIIRDDGAGLDLSRLRAKGIEKGLLEAGQAVSDDELMALIYAPGFSTAETVTELSGRGVGMDVVRNEVMAIGGHIETASVAGKGMTFSVFLPLTLAVTQAVLVRTGTDTFAVSSAMVEQVLSLEPAQWSAARERGSITDRGISYPLHTLHQLLGYPAPDVVAEGYRSVLLLRSGLQRIALYVDGLTRNQEIVVKNINPQLSRVAGVTGATVLADGRVVLIINPVHLTHRMPPAISEAPPAPVVEAPPLAPTVMVVDDSLTVRKITGRLLEREGYRVVTAKDGLDALEQLDSVLPDVMLVDIEMPRMDGFDLSARIRQDARTAAIPIIIISSRTADKHRSRAQQIGVNAFLGKPYQESELLAHVAQYLKQGS